MSPKSKRKKKKKKLKKWDQVKKVKRLSRRHKAPGEQVIPNKKKTRKIKHKKKELDERIDRPTSQEWVRLRNTKEKIK